MSRACARCRGRSQPPVLPSSWPRPKLRFTSIIIYHNPTQSHKPQIDNSYPMYLRPVPYVPSTRPLCTLDPSPMYPRPVPYVPSTRPLCTLDPSPMYPRSAPYVPCNRPLCTIATRANTHLVNINHTFHYS